MENFNVKTWFFIPFSFGKGQTCFLNTILCFSLLALSGCLTTVKSNSLAPSPPALSILSLKQQEQQSYQPYYFADNSRFDKGSLAVGDEGNIEIMIDDAAPVNTGEVVAVKGRGVKAALKGCRFKDRFDRKVVLAYEWNRSRLSLDVDGINLSNTGEKSIRMEYKIRFQPEKPKKLRCRYSSSWQGLVGSGYNEMFVRENDTMWSELRGMRKDAMRYVDRIF